MSTRLVSLYSGRVHAICQANFSEGRQVLSVQYKLCDLQDNKATAAGLQSLLNVMSSVYIPSMQADATWPDTTKREFTGTCLWRI